MRYKIVTGTLAEVEKEVRAALANGWELQGGVTSSAEVLGSIIYSQAIIART